MLLRGLSRSAGGARSTSTSSITRHQRRRAAAITTTTTSAAQRPTSATADNDTAAADPLLAPFLAQVGEKRFTCTQCGKCCTGRGDVWVTEEEAAAIAARTRRPLAAFTKSYSKARGWRLLRDRPGDARLEACIFLGPDDKTCTIHDVRPKQCSLYPWWPGLMDEREWRAEAESVCEGFDHPDAPPTDALDAATQLREATKLEAMRLASYGRGRGGRRRGKGGEEEGELGEEDRFGGSFGARSSADMPSPASPPNSPGGDNGKGRRESSKREGKRRAKGALYDRLMALLDGAGGIGGERGG